MHHLSNTPPKTSAARRRFLVLVAFGLAGYGAACSSSEGTSGSGSTIAAGSSGAGGVVGGAGGGAGLGGGASKSGSTTDACMGKSCNDGIACTTDTCQGGECIHKVDPGACPKGQYCTVEKGCVSAPACATDAQCIEVWKSDPCKAKPRCDAASAVCVFDALDKDYDHHVPLVCGGDDCDDSDGSRYPGAPERCDGKDNDCDGQVDEKDEVKCFKDGTAGLQEDETRTCVANKCECKPEFLCGGVCANTQTDAANCGACGKVCTGGACGMDCVAGACVPKDCPTCPEPTVFCNGECLDTTDDWHHCGTCDNDCTTIPDAPFNSTCIAGKCYCPDGTSLLCPDGSCKDPTSPETCGSCDNDCPPGVDCVEGKCNCPPGAPTICNESGNSTSKICIDTLTDRYHCGGCGHECGANEVCTNGSCN